MNKLPGNQAHIIDIYRRRAKGYDADPVSSLLTWRKEAIKSLNLELGDLVVDIGCGTGLNFPLLQEAIGPQGRIIGVDLTDAMLDQARQRVAAHGWKNVELVQSDATAYEFPTQVHGIISTFALTFVPDCGQVIQKGCKVLAPGRRWVVLDMAWPSAWPPWWRPLIFFLRLPSYGITVDVVQRRPWRTVWRTMELHLVNLARKQFLLGFFYLAFGEQPHNSE